MAKAVANTHKMTAIADTQTKLQIISQIAEETGLPKMAVTDVFDALGRAVDRHLKPKGSGEFTVPSVGVKIRRVMKPARKSRIGRNPKTGEEVKIPAKRAAKGIKLTAMKVLKDKI